MTSRCCLPTLVTAKPPAVGLTAASPAVPKAPSDGPPRNEHVSLLTAIPGSSVAPSFTEQERKFRSFSRDLERRPHSSVPLLNFHGLFYRIHPPAAHRIPHHYPHRCLLPSVQIVAAILAIAGIVMMTYADGFHSHSVIGIALVVGSASMSALYKVSTRRASSLSFPGREQRASAWLAQYVWGALMAPVF